VSFGPRRATALVALAAACTAAATGSAAETRFSACLVTGDAGPWSGPYRPLAERGLRAAERLGIRVRSIPARAPSGYEAALRSCAAGGAAITIAAGFPMAAAVDAVATSLPHSRFAVLDVEVSELAHRPRNVEGVTFAGQEAGYLVGYAAGLWAREHRARAVGSVGGVDVPPVERYLAGFRFGATRADPALRVLHDFAQDVTDSAPCKRTALDQIAHGSVVEFDVAGDCGAGVLAAARESHVVAVGVGTGVTSRRPWVMTSALERVDVAVVDLVRSVRAGELPTGGNVVLDARRDGIGYGGWSPRVPREIRFAVATQAVLLRTGRITGIPLTVK
jgi:basic membrane protein A